MTRLNVTRVTLFPNQYKQRELQSIIIGHHFNHIGPFTSEGIVASAKLKVVSSSYMNANSFVFNFNFFFLHLQEETHKKNNWSLTDESTIVYSTFILIFDSLQDRIESRIEKNPE